MWSYWKTSDWLQGVCQQAGGGGEEAVPVLPQLPQSTGGSDAGRHRSLTNRSRLRACCEADPDPTLAIHNSWWQDYLVVPF